MPTTPDGDSSEPSTSMCKLSSCRTCQAIPLLFRGLASMQVLRKLVFAAKPVETQSHQFCAVSMAAKQSTNMTLLAISMGGKFIKFMQNFRFEM